MIRGLNSLLAISKSSSSSLGAIALWKTAKPPPLNLLPDILKTPGYRFFFTTESLAFQGGDGRESLLGHRINENI
jgi:hypothetical protein